MDVILTLFISTTKLHIISETTKFLGYSLQDLREAPEHQRSARKRPKVERCKKNVTNNISCCCSFAAARLYLHLFPYTYSSGH